MLNTLVHPNEVCKAFVYACASLSPALRRAVMYDLQTSMGGFPHNAEERRRYIQSEQVSFTTKERRTLNMATKKKAKKAAKKAAK